MFMAPAFITVFICAKKCICGKIGTHCVHVVSLREIVTKYTLIHEKLS